MAIEYTPSPTFAQFHADDSFIRAVMGPISSGKSSGMVFEILYRAMRQKPNSRMERKTRFVAVRNTYPELTSTTIETFMFWLGELGTLVKSTPIEFSARRRLDDGTILDLEVWFLSADREEDARKFKSLEATGIWLNEAVELPGGLLDVLKGRVGRYPPPLEGGPTWSGIFMDTNPCSTQHWFYDMFVRNPTPSHKLFRQPPALVPDDSSPLKFAPNPAAENIRAELGGYDYYFRQLEGADENFVNVFILGEFGVVKEGAAVYPSYKDSIHLAKRPLTMSPKLNVDVGMDWGLNPAAVFCQMDNEGKLVILSELTPSGVTFEEFLEDYFIPHVKENYRGAKMQIYGDPAGMARNALSSKTVFEILHERGFSAVPALSNDFLLRRDAVDHFLTKVDGLTLGPDCPVLHEGFLGGYCYDKTGRRPDKRNNQYSHVHDALQYVCLSYYASLSRKPKRARIAGLDAARRKFRYV